MGGDDDIDADGVVGGGPDPVGDGVVADRAGGINPATPAGVLGVEALGDLLGEGGDGHLPGGGVVAELGGDLADDGEAVGRMGDGDGVWAEGERGGGQGRVVGDGGGRARVGTTGDGGGRGGARCELVADLVEGPTAGERGQDGP